MCMLPSYRYIARKQVLKDGNMHIVNKLKTYTVPNTDNIDWNVYCWHFDCNWNLLLFSLSFVFYKQFIVLYCLQYTVDLGVISCL